MRFHDVSYACPNAGAVDQSRIKLRNYVLTYQQVSSIHSMYINDMVGSVNYGVFPAVGPKPSGRTSAKHTHTPRFLTNRNEPASSLSLTLPCVSGSVIKYSVVGPSASFIHRDLKYRVCSSSSDAYHLNTQTTVLLTPTATIHPPKLSPI